MNSCFTKQYGNTLKANTINHKSFDLNDYTATGLYDTRGTLPSNIGMKNYPTDITASIIVLSTTYIVTQIYIAHNATSLYLRIICDSTKHLSLSFSKIIKITYIRINA